MKIKLPAGRLPETRTRPLAEPVKVAMVARNGKHGPDLIIRAVWSVSKSGGTVRCQLAGYLNDGRYFHVVGNACGYGYNKVTASLVDALHKLGVENAWALDGEREHVILEALARAMCHRARVSILTHHFGG